KMQYEVPTAALQAPRGSFAAESTHHEPQVKGCDVHQQTLENVRVTPQMHAPHPARFIQVRKAPLQLLAALPQQPLPTLAPNPPPVPVHRCLLFLLPLPAPPSPLRLRAVAAYLPVRELRQHFVAVVSL